MAGQSWMRESFCWIAVLMCALPLTGNAAAPGIQFAEIGKQAGIRVQHHSRDFRVKRGDVLSLFATVGAAVAVGDYDDDGYEDIFVTDSEIGKPNHLFHNNGNLTFTDVAEEAGVAGGNDSFSIVTDALWFDYDNDGRLDLLVARFGTPLLYHNEGNGKFRNVTAASGLNMFANTVAVIAMDYDNDGKLDLLFANYFKPVNLLDLKDPHVLPNSLVNANNGGGVALWHNMGGGKFENVTDKSGVGGIRQWAFDVGTGDLNNDGLPDIYVACDYGPDHVFFNNGDGTFREVTAQAIGWDRKSGMNVEMADYDNDGWLDVYVTNITEKYAKQCNMLWHNNGDGTFADVSIESGTCDTGWGWAAKFGDFDNDGWQDLFVVNGLHSAGEEEYIPGTFALFKNPGVDITDLNNWPEVGDRTWNGYEKKRLFHNLADGRFQDVAADAGVDNRFDGRGIGVGDFDNDGRLDFVQTNLNQPLLLYRNTTEKTGNWVELKLIGVKSNRDAIGARVHLKAGGLSEMREVDGGNGFASQSSRRVHFGIGSATKIDDLEIRWPSGRREVIHAPINRISYVEEGRGIVAR
jgi:hypothetical protein